MRDEGGEEEKCPQRGKPWLERLMAEEMERKGTIKEAQGKELTQKKHVCKVKSQYLFFVMSFSLNSVMLKCQSGDQCQCGGQRMRTIRCVSHIICSIYTTALYS